jgi:predicted flap endonuclease-1-like 5' DNA nuclease
MKLSLFLPLFSVLAEEGSTDAINPFSGGVQPLTVLLLVVLLILIIWFLLRMQTGQVDTSDLEHDDHGHDDHDAHHAEAHVEEAAPEPAPVSTGPDNLKLLEGIGPKVQSVLIAAGISTFSQLADADVDKIQAVLDEAGYQYMNPASWPAQAKLAASGDWDALKKLQDELDGGRS